MREASLCSLGQVLKSEYEHGIPPREKGQALRLALAEEAVPISHALLELSSFNELLGKNGTFAQDFVKALCNIRATATVDGQLAKAMGAHSELCHCGSCWFSWMIPTPSIQTNNYCPVCKTAARVGVSHYVRMWKCPQVSCGRSFFSTVPKAEQNLCCPSCYTECSTVKTE